MSGTGSSESMPPNVTRIETEELIRCPNCASDDTRYWCTASDLLLATSDQRYEYRCCRRCAVTFLKTRPIPDMFDRIYPDPYHPHRKGPLRPVSAATKDFLARIEIRMFGGMRARFRRRVDSYYAKLESESVFLDFGCGAGTQLDIVARRGCQTIGMDFSERALQQVARSGHRAVPVTAAGWASIAAGSVDFIRANHVLEHLSELQTPLGLLRDKLRPGGMIHLALPNPRGLSALLFRRYWHGLDCPRHFVLYPPEVLRILLGRLGYEIEQVMFEPVTKDHIRSWAYLLKGLGASRESSADAYIERPLLTLLAGLPVSIAVALGRGDRFHIFARRPG